MTSISANGATLYYELRGDGPSLLFISGATGDAGHWTGVADILADTYLVFRDSDVFTSALLSTRFLMFCWDSWTLARISSAVAVQSNGRELLFQCVM